MLRDRLFPLPFHPEGEVDGDPDSIDCRNHRLLIALARFEERAHPFFDRFFLRRGLIDQRGLLLDQLRQNEEEIVPPLRLGRHRHLRQRPFDRFV